MYTVISLYDIYYDDYSPAEHIDISGRELEYIRLDGNKKITSLFSTDPARYLDKRYLPGSKF